jgi:hypothetical protein
VGERFVSRHTFVSLAEKRMYEAPGRLRTGRQSQSSDRNGCNISSFSGYALSELVHQRDVAVLKSGATEGPIPTKLNWKKQIALLLR